MPVITAIQEREVAGSLSQVSQGKYSATRHLKNKLRLKKKKKGVVAYVV
jgi:hypothetical protein